MRNPEKITEMIHLSPAAIGEKPENYRPYSYVEKQEHWAKRTFMLFAYLCWDFHASPFALFKVGGYWPVTFVQAGWAQRIKNPNEEDKAILSAFMIQCNMRKTSTEKCLTVIFSFGHKRLSF